MVATPRSARWLLLIYTLPARNPSARVDIWRKLKRSGALALPTSGHVLPELPANRERFEWIAAEIRKQRGKVSLASVESFEDLPMDRLQHLFTSERNKDYEKLLRELKSRQSPRRLSSLRRRLVEISDVDFFGSSLRKKVENALASLDHPRGKAGTRDRAKQYSKRTWVTRHRPGIDRCSSAWLIQRFIDPLATFAFANDSAQQPDAIPFDMYGDNGFGHRGDLCTFETLCKEFSLRHPALRQIAEIVHDADLDDSKFGRAEGAAIDHILKGWATQHIADDELLRRGMELFEGLYEGLATAARNTNSRKARS